MRLRIPLQSIALCGLEMGKLLKTASCLFAACRGRVCAYVCVCVCVVCVCVCVCVSVCVCVGLPSELKVYLADGHTIRPLHFSALSFFSCHLPASHTHMHIHTHTTHYIRTCTHTHAHTHTTHYIHTCTHTHAHAHTHTQHTTFTHAHTHMHTHRVKQYRSRFLSYRCENQAGSCGSSECSDDQTSGDEEFPMVSGTT